jgi:hypothetical protein
MLLPEFGLYCCFNNAHFLSHPFVSLEAHRSTCHMISLLESVWDLSVLRVVGIAMALLMNFDHSNTPPCVLALPVVPKLHVRLVLGVT